MEWVESIEASPARRRGPTQRAMAAGGVEALLYESLVQDFSALLGDTDSHDLQLRVGAKGELIGAHRVILLCRCVRARRG